MVYAYLSNICSSLDACQFQLVGNIEDKADQPILLFQLRHNSWLDALQDPRHSKEQGRFQAGNIIRQLLHISLRMTTVFEAARSM